MSQLIRRFRGLFVALVVLALSAGVSFAWGGPPDAAAKGLGIAGDASGQTLPARAAEEPTAGADEETEEEAPETEAPEDEATDTHGDLVSEAATMDTPAGFDNHGQFVSCVARMNHGLAPDATPPADLGALTPEDCGLATDAATQSTKTKAPKAHGNAKDHSSHGKAANAPGQNR